MTKEIFELLHNEAKTNKEIIGFFLGGGRGKGFVSKTSDYDIYIIVKKGTLHKFRKKFSKFESDLIDIMILEYDYFKNEYANIGTEYFWNAYNFAHLKILVDKNKKIQKIINQKAIITRRARTSFISGNLDGYINYVYRSLKCFRDKNKLAAHLEAVKSLTFFFDAIFCLHNGRIAPYYKYLQWELKNWPLKKLPIKSKDLLNNINKILKNGDKKTQQKLLKMAEKVFRKEKYGKIFDSWGNKLEWMKR